MDFIDSFYAKDENGKTGAERAGKRNQLERKGSAVNAIVKFNGFEYLTYSNPESPKQGERYGRLKVTIDKILDGCTQQVLEGIEYTIFVDFDSRTVKKSRQVREFSGFATMVAGLLGESEAKLLQTEEGKDTIRGFIQTGGAECVGGMYVLQSIPTGDGWHSFQFEAAPASKAKK
jgi:hypothetical protein